MTVLFLVFYKFCSIEPVQTFFLKLNIYKIVISCSSICLFLLLTEFSKYKAY